MSGLCARACAYVRASMSCESQTAAVHGWGRGHCLLTLFITLGSLSGRLDGILGRFAPEGDENPLVALWKGAKQAAYDT